MDLTLYTVTNAPETIGKNKQSAIALTGNLRANCSLLDPVVMVGAASITSNYAYITQFSRYYFIKKVTAIRTGLFQLDMHVDVLESYATAIKALNAVIKRQQNLYNLYLDDPMFQAQNNRQIITKRIESSAFHPYELNGTACYLLTTVGG